MLEKSLVNAALGDEIVRAAMVYGRRAGRERRLGDAHELLRIGLLLGKRTSTAAADSGAASGGALAPAETGCGLRSRTAPATMPASSPPRPEPSLRIPRWVSTNG